MEKKKANTEKPMCDCGLPGSYNKFTDCTMCEHCDRQLAESIQEHFLDNYLYPEI